MQNKERGAVSWLMEFAGEKRIFYIVSVIAAIIGVICSVAPFLFVSDIVIPVSYTHLTLPTKLEV